MCRRREAVEFISLVLVAVLLWHLGGLRIYAQARAIEKRQQRELAAQVPLRIDASRFDLLLKELKEAVKQASFDSVPGQSISVSEADLAVFFSLSL